MDFFIPVSSLKVFGHSIRSERRMIYLGKSIQALQNDTLSYHDYSVSGSSSQHCSGISLKLLCFISFITYQFRTHNDFQPQNTSQNFHMAWKCHFMLDRLHWCVKQRNRTSVLPGELGYRPYIISVKENSRGSVDSWFRIYEA